MIKMNFPTLDILSHLRAPLTTVGYDLGKDIVVSGYGTIFTTTVNPDKVKELEDIFTAQGYDLSSKKDTAKRVKLVFKLRRLK
jgi:hypothetical protein